MTGPRSLPDRGEISGYGLLAAIAIPVAVVWVTAVWLINRWIVKRENRR